MVSNVTAKPTMPLRWPMREPWRFPPPGHVPLLKHNDSLAFLNLLGVLSLRSSHWLTPLPETFFFPKVCMDKFSPPLRVYSRVTFLAKPAVTNPSKQWQLPSQFATQFFTLTTMLQNSSTAHIFIDDFLLHPLEEHFDWSGIPGFKRYTHLKFLWNCQITLY